MPTRADRVLTDKRTRRAILDRLKQDGPQDATAIAGPLGISPMAVRQHLYELQAQGLASYEPSPRPKGRPAKLWSLTPEADRFFPDGHAELTTGLLGALREAFGEEGLDRLMAARSLQQAAAYEAALKDRVGLADRLEGLAALRTEEGYMAKVEPQGPDAYLLVENHCPICAAASACSGLCEGELEVFRRVLGPGVTVERTDHILAGARRCAYAVRALA